jgi:hypothetical protein
MRTEQITHAGITFSVKREKTVLRFPAKCSAWSRQRRDARRLGDPTSGTRPDATFGVTIIGDARA